MMERERDSGGINLLMHPARRPDRRGLAASRCTWFTREGNACTLVSHALRRTRRVDAGWDALDLVDGR